MGNRKLITYVLVTILILILPALTGFLQQYFYSVHLHSPTAIVFIAGLLSSESDRPVFA